MRQISTLAALTLAIVLVALGGTSRAATIIPYNLSPDPVDVSVFDVYNPANQAGTNVPVEFLRTTLVFAGSNAYSGTPIPAHIVLSSPTGTIPSPEVYIDLYYDGAPDAFPASAYFTFRGRFTTPAEGEPFVSLNGPILTPTSIWLEIKALYFAPFNRIGHEFVFNLGASGQSLSFVGLFSLFGGDLTLHMTNPTNALIDPTQPIARATIRASGVPEPTSVTLAVIGTVGVIAVGWRRKLRHQGDNRRTLSGESTQ